MSVGRCEQAKGAPTLTAFKISLIWCWLTMKRGPVPCWETAAGAVCLVLCKESSPKVLPRLKASFLGVGGATKSMRAGRHRYSLLLWAS